MIRQEDNIWLKPELLLGTNPGFPLLTKIAFSCLEVVGKLIDNVSISESISTFVLSLPLISCWAGLAWQVV